MTSPNIPDDAVDAAAQQLRLVFADATAMIPWERLPDGRRAVWRRRATDILAAAWPWLAGTAATEHAVQFGYPHWGGETEIIEHRGRTAEDPAVWAAEIRALHEGQGATTAVQLTRTVWTGQWRTVGEDAPDDRGSLSGTPESCTVSDSSPTSQEGSS